MLRRKFFPLVGCLVMVAVVGAAGADEPVFRAGAAQVDITPEKTVGFPLGGSYHTRLSTGVLDPIFVKALVVEQGGEKAAFVVLDLSGVYRPQVVEARRLITEQTGIPPERVMISATHTHSAPVQKRNSPMDWITGANRSEALEYTEKLSSLIARAVAEADAKLGPAKASAALGREEEISFNRRFWLKDGTVAWQARNNPDVVRPAGPIDPDVGVLIVQKNEKQSTAPLSAYVNFAMHATVIGGTRISPDFPGYMAEHLSGFLGKDAVVILANGCCGNINQRNPNWTKQPTGDQDGERIGTVLAADVLRTWPHLQPVTTHPPRSKSVVLTLPRRKFTDERIAEAREVTKQMADGKKFSIPQMAEAVCIVDTVEKTASNIPLEAEVQVITFGDEAAFVALPGEVFVELGLAVKKASPFRHTFIAELANSHIGYVPNREAYPEGNYEVVSARGEAGSGEMLVEAAIKLLGELHQP